MEGLKTALLTFWAPVRALGQAADKRLFVWPLVLVTLCGLGVTALSVSRTDYTTMAEEALEQLPAEEAAKLTPHEREEKIATSTKVALVQAGAGGLLGPTFVALGGAFFLWLGLKVAGGKPSFAGAFAVLAHAQLPAAVAKLLAIPALLTRSTLRVGELNDLLPSSLAALAPDGLTVGKLALLGSLDLFALWSVVLVVVGMAHVAKVTPLRASLAVLVLWASFVLVFRFALPSFTPPGPS
jgi:hypothetical protein